ncbi:MAG TPA: PhzF family phenazine biosynthesis protein, partial [Candidatus Cybelea sp.]|nr:PhzF family phenazine biosynthesis protein [Candidatus Cybelea sp.]
MRIPLYQIDAFTDRVFAGNPAAVCPLDAWLDDATMQAIAAENNLSETAFFVPQGPDFGLRWFTPKVEVDLCGHATLATGWLILTRLEPQRSDVTFHSRSGALKVARQGARFALDFPSRPAKPATPPAALLAALGGDPADVLLSTGNYLAVFRSADDVRALKPDFAALARIENYGVIVSAPGEGDVDFVSRYFAAWHGIDEDPVTGAAHCVLTPHWAKRLGKRALHARQISARGGELWCEERGARVSIAGHCAFYMEGAVQ